MFLTRLSLFILNAACLYVRVHIYTYTPPRVQIHTSVVYTILVVPDNGIRVIDRKCWLLIKLSVLMARKVKGHSGGTRHAPLTQVVVKVVVVRFPGRTDRGNRLHSFGRGGEGRGGAEREGVGGKWAGRGRV